MLRIFDEKLNGFLFVVIFPFLLFFMSYYGFESSYVKLKSMEKAPNFMFSSVYAYRVIPNFLMVHVTDMLDFVVNNYLHSLKSFLLKNGTIFYHSIFLINSFFFVLASIILNLILKLKPTEILLNAKIRSMVHLLAVFFMIIVQYVPTNCDSIAVFFYVLGILFTLKYYDQRRTADFIFLCITIFISTFVRETACLNISFFAAIFINFKRIKTGNFKYLKEITFLVLSFVLPYIGLKLMITQDTSFFEGIYIKKNFTSPFNLAGLFFGFLGLYFTFRLCDDDGKSILKKYLFFSLPYLGMITLVGLFWEARLFLPLILSGVIVAFHQFKNMYTV
ncbi:hypothetical protein CHRY9390_01800 [Chryseobacterium aquaeductus]|uniref:Uncharacterized protein n=1 Tax=Chryseobacterium aquaeductus TaxID=2675056 RepID=A0A9N8MG14_9FLAO|nr:hypothetical protein [Chryseobacterium aquaeductus]CAA7331119.1 hypothetical protein CHRY9390_01800 [Chryseobacterium potabilaquae]CAD7808292.1 hypothetical protein CHRY9390_01800 [Chryseobacterium aquaeductus]